MLHHTHQPGSLVRYRARRWIVMPSDEPALVKLRPLSGAEEEATAVLTSLRLPGEEIEADTLPPPTLEDLGDFATARLLFDANRLSFRNANGPFRSMGKLSFRPRSYQVVPLVMALKQEVVRLLIADDVGIGKTVEALIILQELLERGEIQRFAIICPPHLCEQWQGELRDKLDLEAEIIRTSTAAYLDRKYQDGRSIFAQIPYQVISMDYIKFDKRRGMFLENCPEMVVVDEAHTCARPAGTKSLRQQQRHHLLHEIGKNPAQHLVMLTATPHSGKTEEFQSLLALLRPEFGQFALEQIGQNERRKIARHFIQRKRSNIRRWMQETTLFPERDSKEIGYRLSADYLAFYQDVLTFARGLSQAGSERSRRIRYWAALALLRGVMSSPAMGLEMLRNRYFLKLAEQEQQALSEAENPLIEPDEASADAGEAELLEQAGLHEDEIMALSGLFAQCETLFGPSKDRKLAQAIKIVQEWLQADFQPIIFCRYIATAQYVGEHLRQALKRGVQVEVITSEIGDEQRKEAVDALGKHPRRVLVATDCLSEGINLQEHFTAVLHYDLPWNPNRLEQREGRVDRFGQTAEEVKAYLLWGEDNPMDAVVLKVLIRKVRDIQKTTGVAISLGEDNKSIMEAVLNEILLDPQAAMKWANQQLTLNFDGGEALTAAEATITNELNLAAEKAENLRSIFAQESVDSQEIATALAEVDEAIGDVQTVQELMLSGLSHLGVRVEADAQGFIFSPNNLPPALRPYFPEGKLARISFESPTPRGYRYLGRNHRFVEQLCQILIALAFERQADHPRVARTAVVQTEAVQTRTTLIQFRVRNSVREVQRKQGLISEEMYLWGYRGTDAAEVLAYDEAKQLLQTATSAANLSPERQREELQRALQTFQAQVPTFTALAEARALKLVEAHGRFKELVGGKRYEAVEPVLPPDIMGIYLLLPKPKDLF